MSGLLTMKQDDVSLSLPSAEELLPYVTHQLGYPSPLSVNAEVAAEIRQVIKEGLLRIHPRFLFKTTPLDEWKGGVIIGRGLRIHSRRWARLVDRLTEPEILCCFVLTMGEEVDQAIDEAQKDSLFKAYIMDAVASTVAEQLVEQLAQWISLLLADQGYQVSGRFSPGYCDWELKEGQETLFNFLEPASLGVQRIPSGMMLPRKSVSAALVGAREVPLKTPCVFCSQKDCSYRREDVSS